MTAVLNPVFFRNAQGDNVSLSTVRDRFDAAFGARTGDRVGMNCREVGGSGMIIYELHLSLPPVADLRSASNASLGELLDKGGPTIVAGCRRGLVS